MTATRNSNSRDRILLIEDDNTVREVFRLFLEYSGLEILEADCGEVGLEKFKAARVQVVILDLRLPDIDGLEILADLRRQSPATPVIVVSGEGGMNDVIQAMQLGAFDFLTKPLAELSLLNHSIRRALEKARTEEKQFAYQRQLENESEKKSDELEAINLKLSAEIRERANTESELRRTNRALRVLSTINRLISRTRDEALLSQELCRILTDQGGYQISWLGIPETDEGKSFQIVSLSGLDDTDRRKLFRGAGRERCPARMAYRTGKPVILKSGADGSFDICISIAERNDVQSILALPVFFNDENPSGALVIYSSESKAFDHNEFSLLKELAELISHAVRNLRTLDLQKKMERNLSRERDFSNTLIQAMPAFFIALDREGNILSMNRAMLTALNYTDYEASGLNYHRDFIPASEREESLESFSSLRDREGTAIIQNHVLTREGKELLVEWHGRSVFDEKGRLLFLFGIGIDITRRVEAAREKEDLEKRLARTNKMEAIGTLAGGIAHDFNNILNLILGYAGLLKAEAQEGGREESYTVEIENASRRGADLIQRILAYNRLSDHERIPLRLEEVILEDLGLLKRSLPATIELDHHIHDGLPSIQANPTEMHRLFMNLCTNSFHALRDTGGRLDITLDKFDTTSSDCEKPFVLRPGVYLRLTVRDSGHGMDAATMERIFEPYFTTRDPGEGTGLGLATVHGIVRSLDGDISVTSRPDEGAVFTVYLPGIEVETGSLIRRESEPASLPHFDAHVLFVDDSECNVMLGARILEKMGCRVTTAGNGTDALGIFLRSPDDFDLVVTDQTMPGLTGFELAGRILDIRERMPILLVTGHSDLVTEQSARQAGIREFMMKPLELERLAYVLRDMLAVEIENRPHRQPGRPSMRNIFCL